MPNILLIETSSVSCSVAILCNQHIEFKNIYNDNMKHAEKLPIFINKAICYAKENNIIFNAVAVSAGPGSYTGLRIGVSHAKGLCYGLNIPLIAIDTLEIIARNAYKNYTGEVSMICPMVDARRMEVYCCIFNCKFENILEHQAKIIDVESFAELMRNNNILFCGNGAQKCKEVINNENAYFDNTSEILAENMAEIAVEMFNNNEFVDLAYYEPFYLKEFQSTIPNTLNEGSKNL